MAVMMVTAVSARPAEGRATGELARLDGRPPAQCEAAQVTFHILQVTISSELYIAVHRDLWEDL
jgi:hypothetical protein